MKKFIINEDVCKKAGLDIHLLWTLLLLDSKTDFNENIKQLLDKGVLIKEETLLGTTYHITTKWANTIEDILYKSSNNSPEDYEKRIEALIPKLKDIFPTGKKEGTSQCWRGNKLELTQKLKKFFRKFGTTYTDEQILNAAKTYVDSFQGNYQYMRVLKYFILKDELRKDSEGIGYIEEVSELGSILENPEEATNRNWRTTLR